MCVEVGGRGFCWFFVACVFFCLGELVSFFVEMFRGYVVDEMRRDA